MTDDRSNMVMMSSTWGSPIRRRYRGLAKPSFWWKRGTWWGRLVEIQIGWCLLATIETCCCRLATIEIGWHWLETTDISWRGLETMEEGAAICWVLLTTRG